MLRSVRLNKYHRDQILNRFLASDQCPKAILYKTLSDLFKEYLSHEYATKHDEIESAIAGTVLEGLMQKGYNTVDKISVTSPNGIRINNFRYYGTSKRILLPDSFITPEMLLIFAQEIDDIHQPKVDANRLEYAATKTKQRKIANEIKTFLDNSNSTKTLLAVWADAYDYFPSSLKKEVNSAPQPKAPTASVTPPPKQFSI